MWCVRYDEDIFCLARSPRHGPRPHAYSGLMGPPVSLWIHGHTHESFDYTVKGTRIVCNPRGYLPMEPNSAFNPTLTLDIAR